MKDTEPFPIQQDSRRDMTGKMEYLKRSEIPWWLAEEAYKVYSDRFGNSQSLEELAKRGGFGRFELLKLLRNEKF